MRLWAACALSAAFLAGCSHWPGPNDRPEIFVLMGQSNMSGRGVLAEAPADDQAPDARIMLYGNDGVWKPAMEPVDSAAGQVDQVSADLIAAVGPALGFAKSLVERSPGRRLILVPCAKGGSSLDQWAPSQARTTLYGSCLARVREAAPAGRLAGLLWYQGETDAEDPGHAAAWAGKFTRVVQSFRADIGSADLRVMVVGLADPPLTGSFAGRYPGWTTVQAAQRSLALPNHVHVSAAGLAKNSDGLHLSTAGQLALARRMAEAW
jgi:hypothetical protein